MTIFYGVQITTKQPTLTDYELGCINGVIKWSSGRENTELWKNGIVLEDSFSEVSQEIEIEACGSYATMSGFNITIDNAKGLSDRIKALALELVNCEIIFYTFRDGVSSQDHTGKIADWSYDENQIQIECMDSFRSIHKPLLKKTFNTDEFGIGLSSSLIGKYIPECFGYVSKAKIFPILKEEIYETICNSGGIDFDVAPCTNYTNVGASDAYKIYTVHLKTVDKIFAADELAGKFLIEVKGGSDSKKIKSNLASSGGITQLTLYGKLNATPIFWSATGADVTYFQITSVDITYIVSANPIYQFDTLNGKNRLFVLDSTSLEFDDVSEIGGIFDTANINNSGYPGCFILSKPSNVAGDSFYQIFSPLSFLTELAQTINNGGAVTGPHPTPGTDLDMPLLRDVDGSTYYGWVCTSDAGAYATLTIPFKIPINSLFLKGSFSNLLFAFNQTLEFDTVQSFFVYLNVKLMDFLGRTTIALEATDRILFGDNPNSAYLSLDYIIPSEYGIFVGPTAPDILSNLRDSLAINQSLQNLENVIDAEIYPFVVFELKYKWRQLVGSSQMTLFLNQVTIVGEKKLNLISNDLYSKLRGEIFGSDWDGRKTYNLPVINIADMIELIIRNFDERPDVIDTASFDLLSNPTTGLLKNNRIGWQQTEQINSFDLIDKLCLFSFTGLIPKNNGKRALKRFLDVTIVATHKDTNNTILENSIGEKKPTSLANVFNAPQINYAWNPATEKFDSFLKITRLDEDSFPLESTSVSSTFNESFFSIYKLNSVYPGMIQFVITSGPGYSIGDFVTFGGGYNGLTLYGTEVLAVSLDSIFVSDPGTFGLALGTDYTGGSLIKYTNPKKVWPTYAIGYNDTTDEYNEAKENWRLCKLSVTRYGFTRELPSEMSDCKFIPNMETDWSFPAQYNAAKAYMRDLCRWTPFRKEVVPYRLPNTAANASLELLDGITFANSNDNAGTEETGRIVGKTIVPGLGKDYIGIQLMLNPKTT